MSKIEERKMKRPQFIIFTDKDRYTQFRGQAIKSYIKFNYNNGRYGNTSYRKNGR